MDFNPDTWGTVADWVGGLGTTAAFVATAIVVYRDAKVRKIAQAMQIAYVVHRPDNFAEVMLQGKETPVDYLLSNMSQEPIYDVVQFDPYGKREPISYTDVLLPHKQIELAKNQEDRIDPPLVSFRDNAGNRWIRSASGKVHPVRGSARKQKLPVGFNNTAEGLLFW